MAILDYSRTLNAAGQQTPLQGMIETRRGLQGLKANEMAMKQQQQQQEAQQAEMQRMQEARMQGVELLKSGTPDQIAEFGVMNPDVMKDLIAASGFIDEQAVNSRRNYAQNVLSGNVAPREAINERIQEIESRGGNADQLRVTAQGTDEQIVEAARKDFSVIDSQAYKSYMGATGQDSDLTSRQKDFKQYQQLNKTDPEGAKAFGIGAGFVQDDKKRIFKIEDGVKYFSDGAEEPVGPKDKLKTDDMKAPMSQDQALKIVDKAKEGQLKNAGFALTLNDGLKTIDSMTGNGYDPMSASWVNKYLTGTTVGNLLMTEDDQKFVGSVEQMINAIARRETGAAITAFEKEDFFNRYMPVAGDKPLRIKQKRNALERQFKSIRGQAGSVYDAIRVTQGFDGKPSNQVIIKAHPQYGDVTEDDIQETMSQSGMTREQVLAKLGG